MSLTLVCFYILIGLCFLLFVNYKFLKRFIPSQNEKCKHDSNRNVTKIANYMSIPGPMRIPCLGTKWIYLWKYEMSKIHEVYRGNLTIA